MRFVAPTRDDLLALEEKYAQVEALRRARERGEPIPERAVFKALAERFPGVLRELDVLSMDVVTMRRQQLALAMGGECVECVEPWMAWMAAYHALMRVALWVKMRTAKQPDVTPQRMVFLMQGIEKEFGFDVEESFVADVARPRTGRINAVVLARIATMFEVTEAEVRGGLFGTRR
jgi:hypothetical protein